MVRGASKAAGWRMRLAILAAAAACPAPALASCAGLFPPGSAPAAQQRPIEPEDLIQLRDIGITVGSATGSTAPLGLSPDGRSIAFVMSKADIAANRTCHALLIIDLATGSAPRLLAQGGEPLPTIGTYRNMFTVSGFPRTVAPQWSPDGRSIAWLRRDNGRNQIWIVPAAGGDAAALTHSPVDVEDFAWRSDGSAIVFASRPGTRDEAAADQDEGVTGFHFGERYWPRSSSRPLPSASTPLEYATIALGGGSVAPATASEKSLLAASEGATSVDGRRAWTEPTGISPLSPRRLEIRLPSGRGVSCSSPACTSLITALWWLPDGGPLLFLARQGWARGELVLYRWQPGAGNPRPVFTTTDMLEGCVLARTRLVCAREAPAVPRRLVSIDTERGTSRLLYDPNPEFAAVRLGEVRRLHWKTDAGREVRGDLVLPPDYRAGTRLPLIVTQYFSNGFLRGAIGDEYPIHAFAAHGFGVLSIERPQFAAADDPKVRTWEDVNAANYRGWAERRNVLSAVEKGIDQVVELGIADPKRVGITGLSDGASTVAFALANSKRFAAASMSSCCLEPWTSMTMSGPVYAKRMRDFGFPAATANDRQFWAPASIALNAERIDTPLLLQLSDDEYLMALEAFTALREHGKPVDMYIFPDEHHVKAQPAHRLAVYRRNLDWFNFWLRGIEHDKSGRAKEYARWRVWRDQAKDAN